jgi:hypothetical protein
MPFAGILRFSFEIQASFLFSLAELYRKTVFTCSIRSAKVTDLPMQRPVAVPKYHAVCQTARRSLTFKHDVACSSPATASAPTAEGDE